MLSVYGDHMKVLYLSYTGLLEPLGKSQVFAYLERLAKNHKIELVTFEKPTDLLNRKLVANMRRRCADAGIIWRSRRYHHRPRLLATAWDLGAFFFTAATVVRKSRIELVHARSYIPCFVALALKRLFGVPFIFDMRAFWPDEMVAAGRLGSGSLMYRMLKKLERRCLLEATSVVSLTEAATEHLRDDPTFRRVPIGVIPTCVDLARFRLPLGENPLNQRPLLLGCVGTVTGWFRLDWALSFYRALRTLRPDTRLSIITRDGPHVIKHQAERQGLAPDDIEVYARPFEMMPQELHTLRAGLLFFVPGFAKLGSCPTRMGELLASGVPCVVNEGVGDVAEIVRRYGVGVAVPDSSDTAMHHAALSLIELFDDQALPQRCRHAAEEWFSLTKGVDRYDVLYRRIRAPHGEA